MNDILGERDPSVPQTPTRVAEPSRASSLPKRFYDAVSVVREGDAWTVALDARPVRTPGRRPLAAPAEALAETLAEEWRAQDERIDPMTMPLTRLLNPALDGVATAMEEVREDILRFAGSDLVCYRAGDPAGLVRRQRERWDPVLDWAQDRLGARFDLAEGVMFIPQPKAALDAVQRRLECAIRPETLAALHVVTTLTGSALVALALDDAAITPDEAWAAAHVDEDWNIEQWGEDAEALERRAQRRREFDAAALVLRHVGNG